MFRQLRLILEMIRFSHTLFALPFAMMSALLAWQIKGTFQWLELAGILVCMATARSAAMAFNRLADRKIDADNPRTAVRHLPKGLLSVTGVWVFTVVCSLLFVAATGLFLLCQPSNPWPIVLAVPVLLFICAYSYTKRFTSLAHFWLGASLLMAPMSAWIAVLQFQDWLIPLLLGLSVMFWVAGFDIIYACQDADFDKKAKLSSVPATFGVANALLMALVCHILMICLLLLFTWLAWSQLGWVFLVGVLLVAVLLVYEHSLVSADDLSRVNRAFFNVNIIVSLGLFVMVAVQLALKSQLGW